MPSDRNRRDERPVHAVDEAVYEALGDRTRRFAVYYLRSRDRVDVDALADVLTGWENATEGGVAAREDRTRTLDAFRSVHLPLLEDAGIVRYDRTAGVVELAPLPDPVETLIETAHESEGSAGATS